MAWQVPQQVILPPMVWQQHESIVLLVMLVTNAALAAKVAMVMMMAPKVANLFLNLAVVFTLTPHFLVRFLKAL